jgi:hypothetical protein
MALELVELGGIKRREQEIGNERKTGGTIVRKRRTHERERISRDISFIA